MVPPLTPGAGSGLRRGSTWQNSDSMVMPEPATTRSEARLRITRLSGDGTADDSHMGPVQPTAAPNDQLHPAISEVSRQVANDFDASVYQAFMNATLQAVQLFVHVACIIICD